MADNKKPDFSEDELLYQSDENTLKDLLPDFKNQVNGIIQKHLKDKLVSSGLIFNDWNIHFTYISHNWFDDGAIMIKAGAKFLNEKGTNIGLVTHPHIKKATFRIKLSDGKEWTEFVKKQNNPEGSKLH